MIRILLLFWALTQVQGMVSGQSLLRLLVRSADFEWTDDPEQYADSTAAAAFLEDWIAQQRGKAYWEASVDSLYRQGNDLQAILHLGPQYSWAGLAPPAGEDARYWLRKAGFRPQRFTNGRPLRPEEWTSVRDSTLVRAADAGYPFAAIRLTDVNWVAPGQLNAQIALTTGPQIRVGEVRAPEGARIRTVFLERYLGLQPGEPYRERRIRQLSSRLRQLPYLSLKGPPRISFQDSLAFFDLPLERKPASRFDFVIGVLPNSNETGKLLITGDLNGELYNGFGQGERVALRFEQLRPQTQELELAIDYPFLFGLPFGFEGELELYRRDSSFLNLNWRLAATYLREGNDRFSIFWENRRSIVPGQDSGPDRLPNELPDTLGVVRSFFGLQARRSRTDRRFSPRQGYAFDLSAAAGFRRLPDVLETDSLAANSGQVQLAATLDAYLDPLPGTVIYLGLKGAGIFGSEVVLPNEQYRLGGAKLLRGFDEQSIFARDYVVLTAEMRLLLGGNAYLFGFVDAGRVNLRNKTRPDIPIDYPIGLGAGVTFDTQAGVFGLSLALGRRNGVPLDLGAPKVHLGYVSVF
jgi:outer membrane protein assembly factor BamA